MADPPLSESMQPQTKAGFFRRSAATATDVFAGLLGAFLVLSLVGLSIPMDGRQMAVLTRPVMFFGALYVGIGPYLFANSLGKYAFAVRIVSDRNGARPALWQFLVRWALLILWPLELIVLILSPSKKRIGDRLASTTVVEDAASKARWGRRIGISLTALFVLYLILVQSMQAAARNTEMFRTAAAFFQENRIGEDTLGGPVTFSKTPLKVVMKKDKGSLITAAEGSRKRGYIELSLIREADGWEIVRWEVTDEPSGRGYSYSY
ncbi:MAG: RDD family protein [Desulfobacterales bacterium]